MPHKQITPIFCQTLNKPNPSKDIFRITVLKCVNGKMLHKTCIHFGKTVIGKNVPDNSICGNANKFISNEIVASVFTTLEKIKPTPIKTINIKIETSIISIKVVKPFIKVKPNQNFPTRIKTIMFNS